MKGRLRVVKYTRQHKAIKETTDAQVKEAAGKSSNRSSKKNSKERMESGSSVSNNIKNDSRSKMTSGSKDLCGNTTEKKNQENGKAKSKDITFIMLQKNMRSIHSSERIEEMVCELEGYRWDAILMSETWRPDKSEIWETHQKHMFMGAGKYDNKYGVGIMLNRKWRQQIIDTEHINERAITATIVVIPPTHQTGERLLLPLGICRPAR